MELRSVKLPEGWVVVWTLTVSTEKLGEISFPRTKPYRITAAGLQASKALVDGIM